MIRKIKKYKLAVRPYGVLRQLKKQVTLGSGQEPQDSDLETLISKVQPHVSPCALYASFSKSETPPSLQDLWKSSPEKSLSLSVVCSTLGRPIEQEIERISRKKEGGQVPSGPDPDYEGALWNSVARESLEQSFNFIEKLIGEEAGQESCVLSPLLPAAPAETPLILQALESHKAEITVNDSGQIIPFFTGLRYCFWTPAKGTRPKK